MRAAKVALVVLAALALSVEDASAVQVGETAAAGLTGTVGCQYWRVRSITKAISEFWQIQELEFYETKDASGTKVATSSITEAHSSTYKDAPEPGQPDTSQHHAIKAVDGDATTFWSSSSDLKFEYVMVMFDAAKDIRSIKMQLQAANMGPAMVIVEKSFDGIHWARSTEISDMLDWGASLQSYPLINMDVVPPSTYALRSQVNPRFCMGVKPTPAASPEDPDLPLAEDAEVEMQLCADATTTQYWQLRSNNLLASSKDIDMVVYHDSTPSDGAVLKMKKFTCTTGDDGSGTTVTTCPSWEADNKYQFSAEATGGLMYVQQTNNQHLVLAPDSLAENAAVKLGACGSDGTAAADIANCASLTNNQFELKPMFLVESNKMAIGCAPYTHMNLDPSVAATAMDAMTLCAKDADCLAFNWADSTATCPSTPPCEGKWTLHSWSCTTLHEVHSGQSGWSLGVRAGKLEPFVEEKLKVEEKMEEKKAEKKEEKKEEKQEAKI